MIRRQLGPPDAALRASSNFGVLSSSSTMPAIRVLTVVAADAFTAAEDAFLRPMAEEVMLDDTSIQTTLKQKCCKRLSTLRTTQLFACYVEHTRVATRARNAATLCCSNVLEAHAALHHVSAALLAGLGCSLVGCWSGG